MIEQLFETVKTYLSFADVPVAVDTGIEIPQAIV
jgi:hypothetical protein